MTQRAVSDVIGYLMIVSLVALTVAIVGVAGVSMLEDTRNSEQAANAERAFDVLADTLSDIHREGAPSRATELTLAGATLSTAHTASMQVRAYNGSHWLNVSRPIQSDVITWESTRDQSTQIVYAFGAILRSQADGGILLRSAPFQFDTDRTILPIVQTRTRASQTSGGGIVRVRGVGSSPSISYRGGVPDWDIWVNITTRHADIWERYLTGETATSCLPPAGSGDFQTVACELDDSLDELYVTVHPIDVTIER